MTQFRPDTQPTSNKWSKVASKSIVRKDHHATKFLQLLDSSTISQELWKNSLSKKNVIVLKLTAYCKPSDAQETLVKSLRDSPKHNINTDSWKDQQAWLSIQPQASSNSTWKMHMSFLKLSQKELRIFKMEANFQQLTKEILNKTPLTSN